MRPVSLALLIFGFMLIEARRAAQNERGQRALGGIEPEADGPVYQAMQIAYPGAFAAMLAELVLRGTPPSDVFVIGAALFTAAKATGGPYRYTRHPNYIGVFGELVGAALMTGAVITGPLATMAFTGLMWRRIAVEQRALDAAR